MTFTKSDGVRDSPGVLDGKMQLPGQGPDIGRRDPISPDGVLEIPLDTFGFDGVGEPAETLQGCPGNVFRGRFFFLHINLLFGGTMRLRLHLQSLS
jgi:hypothetical protein